jgi:para-nitrobenzyl esterase
MLGSLFTALIALTVTAGGAQALNTRPATAAWSPHAAPVVRIDGGAVRGAAVSGVDEFLGLPYAAPPTGALRWRPPQPAAAWDGVRDATQFGPSCPQPASPFAPPAPFSEDCLYLNVYAPTTLRRDRDRPVLVWIHGGGFTEDGARNYDGAKLAADGVVVVTINYRLGALGFLAHPALASRPGGPTGNYGLMDQIAALRWVTRNIARFGGDPHNVTIAGQSAGGVSVLDLLVSHASRGLFQRAIVQSGAFALTQQPLAGAEAAGEAFAVKAGCPDQSARCLRHLPVDALVGNFPGAAIPGVIDGKILTESIGTALAAGRFAHVPILNGNNQDEEFIFVLGLHVTVSDGTFAQIPEEPINADSYQPDIAAVLGVSSERAAAIAAEYPLEAYPSPDVALSTLVSDANFACPALQFDRWTSRRVPTFAYQFNDSGAPERFAGPPLPPAATHSSEAWASFAANGDPPTPSLAWPSVNQAGQVMSLVPPEPQVWAGFSDAHHCSFWGIG